MPTPQDIREAKRKLTEQLKQLRAAEKGLPLPDQEAERKRDADRKKTARTLTRRVHVSVSTASLRRRSRLERNCRKWLRYYFPDVFEYDFTENQGAIVDAILTAATEGGDQAIAAPRGDGKTSIAECVIMFCVLKGILVFPVIFSATGDDAERILGNIKQRLEENERLVEDYNEVCGPAAALESQPNRANGQVVYGNIGKTKFNDRRSKIRWSGRQIVLPTIKVKGSRATGSVIATRGLDAAVRGLRFYTKRPDLAVIDDPETRDMACIDEPRQREKLELKIDQDIAGLAGQTRRLSRVVLTTIMSRKSLSYKLTDPEQKPTFRGRRFRYLVEPPERQDLWDEFQILQQADWTVQPRTTKAHDFYLKHRKPMDAGAVVGNPHRRGDGIEASALESYYVEVARIGQESVSTEYDNDPPEETGPVESGITSHLILQHMSGYERCVIPPGCTVLTQGIDVGKYALHWAVFAWKPDGTGYMIDRGVEDVHGTKIGHEEGVEHAILHALRSRVETANSGIYRTLTDETMPIDPTFVDARYKQDASYAFVREMGLSVKPAIGHGKSAGCATPSFRAVTRATKDRKPGDHWFTSRQPKGVWLVNMDTDYWKAWLHARFMTATDKPGTMLIYGIPSDNPNRRGRYEKELFTYSKHIAGEIEVEDIVKGVTVRRFQAKTNTIHWLDASYMACVAANMKGIRLLSDGRATGPPVKGGWFAAQTHQRRRKSA